MSDKLDIERIAAGLTDDNFLELLTDVKIKLQAYREAKEALKKADSELRRALLNFNENARRD